jgi:signal transduction histidine kinase
MIGRHNAEARCQQLHTELPDDLPLVQADRTLLRRVLGSLVENAIKYTPDGGRITLATAADAARVQVRVSDSGRGILAEDLPHIFEKFYRGRAPALDRGAPLSEVVEEVADAPGVGLGLYLARTIVEQIGGEITVESTPGRGSTFTLALPLWDNRSHFTNHGEQRDGQAAADHR